MVKFLKPCPLISEKLAFGCTLFPNVESDTGIIQKMKIASFATIAVQATDAPLLITSGQRVHDTKMASTGTYLSTYLITVNEGGLSLPSSCEGEGKAPLATPPPLPIPMPLACCIYFRETRAHNDVIFYWREENFLFWPW